MKKPKVLVYGIIGLVVVACLVGVVIALHSGLPLPHGG
jgi:hypothetical protein